MLNNINSFSNIAYMAMIAFFGAVCREINDKSKTQESFGVFFGEIFFHGFSGWMTGLVAFKYLDFTDLIGMTLSSGVGGLFGFDLLKIIVKVGSKLLATAKDVSLNDSDLDFEKKPKKKTTTRKKTPSKEPKNEEE